MKNAENKQIFNGKELVKAISENTIKVQQEQASEFLNPFPVSAFPKAIQEIINALEKDLNFPKDYTASAILFAVSVALGKRYQVKVKGTWIEKAILFLALVGYPGSNKTHPLHTIVKPLLDK
ncbi:MAG: YfjI family protein, partial [Raineya sp.]|nr:YfjI family protein [Raineya sp.]